MYMYCTCISVYQTHMNTCSCWYPIMLFIEDKDSVPSLSDTHEHMFMLVPNNEYHHDYFSHPCTNIHYLFEEQVYVQVQAV